MLAMQEAEWQDGDAIGHFEQRLLCLKAQYALREVMEM